MLRLSAAIIGAVSSSRIKLVLCVALVAMAAGSASGAAPEVGVTVPDLALSTLGDSQLVLSQRDGPTVLVFFRGAW